MDKPSNQEAEQWHKREIANAIIRYLNEYPQASDTLRGIAEWWIMRQKVEVEYHTLEEVLRELTEKGVLNVTGEGERRRYSLNARANDPLLEK